MKKVKMMSIVLCLSALPIVADTNGISLTLNFQYTEMFEDEWYNYSITISNGSPNAIQILKDPQDMIAHQFIFELGTKKEYHRGYYQFDDGWDKQRAFGKSRKRAVPLPSGKSHTWNILYGYSQLDGANKDFGVTNLTVRCLLDTNQWVRSNTVPLTFYPSESKIVVFDPQDDGKRLDEGIRGIDNKLYKVTLGDKVYLFNVLGDRLCEIQEGDVPEIRRDAKKDCISIFFPESKRKILYNRRTTEIKLEHDMK
jgi:hypothetical protein